MHLLSCHSRFLRVMLLGATAAWWWCCALAGEVHAEKLLEWSAETSTTQAASMDAAVVPASFDELATAVVPRPKPADPRRLAPQSSTSLGATTSGPEQTSRQPTSISLPQIESLTTAGTGLAIVVGLFLICMWLLRRGGPKPTTPLPADAVSVLGKIPLANQSFAQLLQIGNKLVLVGMNADGMTPLTEVTDPAEVERLLSICHRNRKQSTTAEFQQVLQQLSQEPAQGFLGNEASNAYARANR